VKKVIYIMPLLDIDLEKGSRCLNKARSVLNSSNVVVEFLVVLQTTNPSNDLSSLIFSKSIEVLVIPNIGTSVARNHGIEYALNKGYNFIGFLDAGIFMSNNFGCAINRFLSKDVDEIFCGALSWVDCAVFDDIANDDQFEKSSIDMYKRLSSHLIRPLRDTYVGCFLFPSKEIRRNRFNPALGPGTRNSLCSGEDVDFLIRIFGYNNLTINHCKTALIYHEKRKGNAKRLQYAVGQGALYRFLVSKALLTNSYLISIRIHILFYFILFCTRSIIIFISNGQIGREIFKRRFFGFFNRGFQSNFSVDTGE